VTEAIEEHDASGPVGDPGAVRNTLLQLASQITSTIFSAGLVLFLVRELGASRYGIFALALSIGGLALFPAGFGLPMSVGRFMADHRGDLRQVRAILRLGMRLQVPAALVVTALLFVLAHPIARAYGYPDLVWPLRWSAVSVFGQAMYAFLSSVVTSIRRVSVGLWMSIIESATECVAIVALVLAGAGAAGAVLGAAIGYLVAAGAGILLTVRLVGGMLNEGVTRQVGARTLAGYAGAMLVVDVTWTAIAQIDLLLIGALLTSRAVGRFGAVLQILTVLGYLGTAVSSGVAPRISSSDGTPDARTFNLALRYLAIVQGVVIGPMVVWAGPITRLLLGPGYGGSAPIVRVLAVFCFVAAPASLISVTVTYLGEARRRVVVMLVTLGLGLVSTYVLLRTVGLIGAAIGDDLIEVIYVAGHVWICGRLIKLDGRGLTLTVMRTLLAAAAMSLVLWAIGMGHLSVLQWIAGAIASPAAFASVLILTRELTVAELRELGARLWAGVRPGGH
jgi:O-antigen/teichoic acid export membrane protein